MSLFGSERPDARFASPDNGGGGSRVFSFSGGAYRRDEKKACDFDRGPWRTNVSATRGSFEEFVLSVSSAGICGSGGVFFSTSLPPDVFVTDA